MVIGEAAAMPARLRALHHQAVSAGLLGSTRLIDRGQPGSKEYTPERLIRARSCVLGELQCPRAAVSEDLTWVLVFGDDAQRRTAVRLLERIGA